MHAGGSDADNDTNAPVGTAHATPSDGRDEGACCARSAAAATTASCWHTIAQQPSAGSAPNSDDGDAVCDDARDRVGEGASAAVAESPAAAKANVSDERGCACISPLDERCDEMDGQYLR